MKSKIKQTASGGWIFPGGIRCGPNEPEKFAKLIRDPRAGAQAQARKAASRKRKKRFDNEA